MVKNSDKENILTFLSLTGSKFMLHLYDVSLSPNPNWSWAHTSIAWGTTNQTPGTTKEEVTRDIKRKTETRPFLRGLVCSHIPREYCLLNKTCLLELSWFVISILCYDKTRTEGELTQHTFMKYQEFSNPVKQS